MTIPFWIAAGRGSSPAKEFFLRSDGLLFEVIWSVAHGQGLRVRAREITGPEERFLALKNLCSLAGYSWTNTGCAWANLLRKATDEPGVWVLART